MKEEHVRALFSKLKEKHSDVHQQFLNLYGFTSEYSAPNWVGGSSDADLPREDKLQEYANEILTILQARITALEFAS